MQEKGKFILFVSFPKPPFYCSLQYPNLIKRQALHKHQQRKRGHELFNHGRPIVDDQRPKQKRVGSSSSCRPQPYNDTDVYDHTAFNVYHQPLPFHADDITKYRQRWKDMIKLDEERYRLEKWIVCQVFQTCKVPPTLHIF